MVPPVGRRSAFGNDRIMLYTAQRRGKVDPAA
jgi:hypothetical protein